MKRRCGGLPPTAGADAENDGRVLPQRRATGGGEVAALEPDIREQAVIAVGKPGDIAAMFERERKCGGPLAPTPAGKRPIRNSSRLAAPRLAMSAAMATSSR